MLFVTPLGQHDPLCHTRLVIVPCHLDSKRRIPACSDTTWHETRACGGPTVRTDTMSARDVDLEFEKAYQRLFGTSAPTEAGGSAHSSFQANTAAESSKTPHTCKDTLRLESGSAAPSAARVVSQQRQARNDQVRASSSHRPARRDPIPPTPRATPTERGQPLQQPKSRSNLYAFARYDTPAASSSSKEKGRTSSNRDPEDRYMGEHEPRVTYARGASSSLSVGPPQGAGMAYYQYPHNQVPYQVAAPLVGPGLASVPGQAVTWAQPVVSAGSMTAVAYPGFSASVTFSQPQFFASHPPQVQPTITTLPSDTWPPQYTPQDSGMMAPSHLPAQQRGQQHLERPQGGPHLQQQRGPALKKPMAAERKLVPASIPSHSDSRRASALKQSLAPAKRSERHLTSIEEGVSGALKQEPKAKGKQWKPLLDENGMIVPRKRGRPRLRPLSPEDAKPVIKRPKDVVRVKKETVEELVRGAASPSTAFDGSLPLHENVGPPYNLATHTLFIHPSRRLRWLARLAVTKVDPQAITRRGNAPSPSDTRTWARWGASIAARLQLAPAGPSTPNPPAQYDIASSAASQSQSQPDPAGLFPRERRREYVALRKQLHANARTASSRICIRRFLRYLARTAVSAARITSRIERRRYVEEKHQASKLAKHLLRAFRPATLDPRTMWSVWARAAHSRTISPPRKLSFAPPAALLTPSRQVRIKLEPESPSARRVWVKDEPVTPPRPVVPSMRAGSDVAVKLEPESRPTDAPLATGRTVRQGRSPLFLRRNFRIYRLLGLSDFPLS